MKKRYFLLSILLVVTLTLIVSCNNEVVSGSGYGSVTISTGNNSKSVQPAADKIAFSYYVIHCSCSTPGINPIEKRFEGSSVKIENMVEGQWTLYVEGFNSSDELIGKSASQNVTIVRDSTTNLLFLLTAIDGQGTLSLSINVQTSKVSTIDCSLKVGGELYRTITMTLKDRVSNPDGSYTFSKLVTDVENGFYSSTVTMKDLEENIIGVALTPAIHIYANQESVYEFSWENLKNLLPSVDHPTASVNSGRCFYNTEVSFSTIEEGATIYYSFTGSDYQEYTSALHITEDSTIYAYSEKQNLNQSVIVQFSYTCKVKTPAISLDSGNHTLSELSHVIISEEDTNATIYYTVDGSDPSVSDTKIEYVKNTSLSFTEDTNLRIVAIEDGFLNSEVLSVSYVVAAQPPVASLQSGNYVGDQELSFIVPEGSQVFYTCDGSSPDENSTPYTEPILLTDDCIIKAVAVKPGIVNSSIIILNYVIDSIFNITYDGTIVPKDKKYITSTVIIPEKIDGVTVRSIGESAFLDCSELTEIIIPNTVTSIGKNAFSGCSGLTRIIIPSSVVNFEYSSIYHQVCGVFTGYYGTVIFGEETTAIADYALYCSDVSNVSIPSTVTEIGDHSFYRCYNLTSIDIPESVKEIGNRAFWDCTGLESMNISNFTSIGSGAFGNCTGLTSIVIPESITKIESYTFYGCSGLISLCIPNTIKTIDDYAFYGCTGISNMTIPSSVSSIGSHVCEKWTSKQTITIEYRGFVCEAYSWTGCNATIEVSILDSVIRIGDYAFRGCKGLRNINIPNSVEIIANYAFAGCGFSSIDIPESVEEIGDYAFSGCYNLTSIVIPDSVTSLGSYAIYWCESLTSVTLGNSLTSIGYALCRFCEKLTSIVIPDSVTSIGREAFFDCGLTSVTLGNSVQYIGADSFAYCHLESLVLPGSLKYIGQSAFYGCGLSTFSYSDTVANWLKVTGRDELSGRTIICTDGVYYEPKYL